MKMHGLLRAFFVLKATIADDFGLSKIVVGRLLYYFRLNRLVFFVLRGILCGLWCGCIVI